MTRAFSLDAIDRSSGPPELRHRRSEAAERAAATPMPSPAEEVWRYTTIDELDLSAWKLDRAATSVAGPLASSPPTADDLGCVLHEPTDVFADWNAALSEPTVLRIGRNERVENAVHVRRHVGGDGTAVFPRLIVRAGAGSEVTIVEHLTSDDVEALVCPVVEVEAGSGAVVRYVLVNELGPRIQQIATHAASGDRDSSTLLGNVSLGGRYARVRTDQRLVGVGAEGRQVAVYFSNGRQLHDVRTLADHVAPRTSSDLLFKGAVGDHGRSVYTGLIRIGKDARGAVAHQTNRNLKLSEHAWAESVPNLDIQNNDVRCSHASAVGPIDAEQRFYLRSRGVPGTVADRLIVAGFFSEALDALPSAVRGLGIEQRLAGLIETVTDA